MAAWRAFPAKGRNQEEAIDLIKTWGGFAPDSSEKFQGFGELSPNVMVWAMEIE